MVCCNWFIKMFNILKGIVSVIVVLVFIFIFKVIGIVIVEVKVGLLGILLFGVEVILR